MKTPSKRPQTARARPPRRDYLSYTYANRLRTGLSVQAPSASAWQLTYTYDGANRLSTITSADGTLTYHYPSGIQNLAVATNRTVALVPGMVNLLVDGTTLLLPKPFGPRDGGVDTSEAAVDAKLPGFTTHYLDDWATYHAYDGEVHCGTNVKRLPPGAVRWWE